MTASSPSLTAEALATLEGFLRGIERRAVVLAELACGGASRGDAAVEATVHAFCRTAARGPLADWNACFWGLLLATPQLRRHSGGQWAAPWERLAVLGPGVRAALLLRLVAGLDDGQAAAVLGIAPATVGLAVERALGERGVRAESPRWQGWVLASRQQSRLLPAERLGRLARARDAALHGRTPRRHRLPGWRPLLWAALVACVLALLASFLLPFERDAPPEIGVTALPPSDPPLERFDADTALLTHPDFDQLTAPPAQQALARELEFYAWYAAQRPSSPAPDSVSPGTFPGARMHAPE